MRIFAYYEDNALVFKIPNAHPSLNADHLEALVSRAIGLSHCGLTKDEVMEAVLRGVDEAFDIYDVGFAQ